MAYRHIVLFKPINSTSDSEFYQALDLLKKLGEDQPGIISWTVTSSIDTRKGWILIEDATFTDAEAFEKFRNSEKHQQAGEFMRQYFDWLVGDYISNDIIS
jgi:quinol monooxygenase YgiN